MNWVEGFGTWGVPAGFEFVSCREEGDSFSALYRQETCEVAVERRVQDGALYESYTFRNTGSYDLYYRRGGIGIFATFNDSYDGAEVCVDRRCDTHIWCGGAHSWILAQKMGPYPTDLALILRRGALDSYSVRRIQTEEAGNILIYWSVSRVFNRITECTRSPSGIGMNSGSGNGGCSGIPAPII